MQNQKEKQRNKAEVTCTCLLMDVRKHGLAELGYFCTDMLQPDISFEKAENVLCVEGGILFEAELYYLLAEVVYSFRKR